MKGPRPARFYALTMLACLVPVLALVAYAVVADRRQATLAHEADRRQRERLVVAVVEQALRVVLDAETQRLHGVDAAGPAWSRVHALAADPAVDAVAMLGPDGPQALAQTLVPRRLPAARPPAPGDTQLERARRLEHVERRPDAAAAIYTRLLTDDRPGVRAAALAGLVGCDLDRGHHARALALLDPVGTHGDLLPWDECSALFLLVAPGLVDPAFYAAVGGHLYRYGRVTGRDGPLMARLDARLRAVDDAGLQRELAVVDALLARPAGHADWRQRWSRLPAADRDGLFAGRSVTVGSELWLPLRTADGDAVVALELAAFLDRVAAHLANTDALDHLAATVTLEQRYRHGVRAVATPWGDGVFLSVRLGSVTAGPTAAWPRVLLGTSAVVGVLLGFGLLWWMMRRDLQLIRLRDDFVASITHELKTPLSLIRMFAESLQLGYETDEAGRRRSYGVIIEETDRLALLVDNVLYASRPQQVRGMGGEVVDPAALVAKVRALYQRRLEQAGFDSRWDISDDLPLLEGDGDALQQVLRNLIDNAIKYSGERRRLRVSAAADGRAVVIAVSDAGIGIAPADRRRVFDQYYRCADAMDHDRSGLGLGLALARDIVVAHGGGIAVAPGNDGGSIFTVRLPGIADEDPATASSTESAS